MEDEDKEAGTSAQEFLPGYPTLDSYKQEFLRTMAGAIRASNAMPSERKEDWDYYTTFKNFRQVAQVQQETIEKSIAAILKYNSVKGRATTNDVSGMLERLADANDQILERVGMSLDDASGIKKKINPLLIEVSQTAGGRISGSWNKRPDKVGEDSKSSGDTGGGSDSFRLLAAKNVARPQVNFKDRIDNSTNPHMPRMTEKPHSMKPLSILIEYDNDGNECYSHPYAFEIDHFRLPEKQLEKRDPKRPKFLAKSLNETPLVMVDTTEKLGVMIDELSKEKEIAVDLEAHNYRSYLGLTCLIQISSEEKDYLVDPFPLWNDLTVLNEIFANPRILKILHGAVCDIGWLQRDFSVYIVNLFDTHFAAKILEFPRGCLSLAFLLHHYCKVSSEKRFQLADWRIRPLIEEMIEYARTDTHYLIDIYHCMKDELIEKGNEQKNLLNAAYTQSNTLCKQIYTKPRISHLPLLQKCKVNFNSRQLYAFKELYNWRNKLARQEDESEAYILPTHMLIKISTELPREMQGILACCNPIPPLVKQYLHEVHQLILKAREQAITSVNPDAIISSESASGQTDASTTVGVGAFDIVEDPLKCPLDLGHFADAAQAEVGLKVLLDKDNASASKKKLSVQFKPEPSLDLFDSKPNVVAPKQVRLKQVRLRTFLTPFERFQMLRPYLNALNEDMGDNNKNDEDRIRSIKEHFDALTAMTPGDYAGDGNKEKLAENEEANGDQGVEEKEPDDEDEPESLSLYNPDPGQVVNFRKELASARKLHQAAASKKAKKRKAKDRDESQKSSEAQLPKVAKTDAEVSKNVDFTQVDFSQYSGGAKKSIGNANEFNPWKNYDKKGKNSKQKQRYKPAADKSISYKK